MINKIFKDIILAIISLLVMMQVSFSDQRFVKYVVSKNDTLSGILYSKGIGTKNSKYNLYGYDGQVNKNIELNPHVKNWNNLVVGTRLLLVLPTVKENKELYGSRFWKTMYVVKKGNTLSGILYAKGIGGVGAIYKLYPRNKKEINWLRLNIEYNSQIADINLIEIGTPIYLVLPRQLQYRVSKRHENP